MQETLTEKELVDVEIPHQLLLEILYINHLIEIRHPSAIEETDDCIQTDYICGGLWNKKKNIYGLTYYPNKAPDRVTWDFELTKKEIQQISKGKIDKIKLWKCKNEACNNYYANKDSYCSFCNPRENTLKPLHTPEELQKLHENKLEQFKKWKENQNPEM